MKTPRADTIDTVLTEIHQRWGSHALQPARQVTHHTQTLSTSIAKLDDLLDRGIPTRKITAFTGIPTSGMTTLAYRLIAHTHQQGSEAVFIDLDYSFNGAYAAACGIDPERLLVTRPPDMTDALELVRHIALSGVVRLVVLDSHADPLPHTLYRLHQPLAQSDMALLLLARKAVTGTHSRVHIGCMGWLHEERDVIGCRIQATLQQHPTQPTGRQIQFDLTFGVGGGDV